MYMKYNATQMVKDRIRFNEERHCELSIDLKVAEALKNDEDILSAREELKIVETILKTLNEL